MGHPRPGTLSIRLDYWLVNGDARKAALGYWPLALSYCNPMDGFCAKRKFRIRQEDIYTRHTGLEANSQELRAALYPHISTIDFRLLFAYNSASRFSRKQ